MTHDKFYDVKALQESWGTNFNTHEEKNQIKWHDIRILRVENEHPEEFFYKTSFAQENFRKACVRKRNLRAKRIFFYQLCWSKIIKSTNAQVKKKCK